MPQAPARPWYKKKRYLLPLGFLGLTVFGLANAPASAPVQNLNTAAVVQGLPSLTGAANVAPITVPQSVSPVYAPTPVPATTSSLSNDNHYVNVSGNTVHSPAYTQDGSIPSGASAKCSDGTYSFSQHRRGTCSHHGGVMVWY